MVKKKNIILLAILLLILFGDFFIVSRTDAVARSKTGYSFNHPDTLTGQWQDTPQYGLKRIEYNLNHFSLFWTKIPPNIQVKNFYQLMTLDGNPLWMNLSHLVLFFIFSALLMLLFGLSWWKVLILGMFVNIFHEYISEGIYVDPSFIDLWLDNLGIILGIIFALIFFKKGQSPKSL